MRSKEEGFFFEKKKQKTFGELDRSAPPQDNASLIDKVFLLLFVHKKKILPAAQPIDFTCHLSGRKVLHERYLYDDGIAGMVRNQENFCRFWGGADAAIGGISLLAGNDKNVGDNAGVDFDQNKLVTILHPFVAVGRLL